MTFPEESMFKMFLLMLRASHNKEKNIEDTNNWSAKLR